jgi:hypothetical protein
MAMVALVLLLSGVSHAEELITERVELVSTVDELATRSGSSSTPTRRRVPEPGATVLLLLGLSMIGFGSYCAERRKRSA